MDIPGHLTIVTVELILHTAHIFFMQVNLDLSYCVKNVGWCCLRKGYCGSGGGGNGETFLKKGFMICTQKILFGGWNRGG